MSGGYMGKMLFVDLSIGTIKGRNPRGKDVRDLHWRLWDRSEDPLQPAESRCRPAGAGNTLGLISGPLTGTPTPTGVRYTAVAKSPLTGGWGDANSGVTSVLT